MAPKYGIVNYTPEEARAIVDEADRLHTPVAAHAVSREGLQAALDTGVDSIGGSPSAASYLNLSLGRFTPADISDNTT